MAKRVLTDADVDRIENDPDRDWFHVLDLIHTLREARRERDAARAALREAIPIVALHVPASAECWARWRRTLGEET